MQVMMPEFLAMASYGWRKRVTLDVPPLFKVSLPRLQPVESLNSSLKLKETDSSMLLWCLVMADIFWG